MQVCWASCALLCACPVREDHLRNQAHHVQWAVARMTLGVVRGVTLCFAALSLLALHCAERIDLP